jgi:hypothetical protein
VGVAGAGCEDVAAGGIQVLVQVDKPGGDTACSSVAKEQVTGQSRSRTVAILLA